MTRLCDPGSASAAEIATHWAVTPATARRLLDAAGLPMIGQGRRRHLWRDVWRLEGEPFVPPTDWAAFRAPLLRPGDLPAHDPQGRSARTLRRLVQAGRLPAIRLAPGLARFSPRRLAEVLDHA